MDVTLSRLPQLRDRLAELQQQIATEAQMPEPDYTRFACANPIRGIHGYFAGCADSGAHNLALLKTPIHTRGGMEHEIALHEHERDRSAFIREHGAKAYQTRHATLTQRAEKGARSLSDKDRTTLKSHQKALANHIADLTSQKGDHSAAIRKARDEMLMMEQQLRRAGTKIGTSKTSSKSGETAKSASTKSSGGETAKSTESAKAVSPITRDEHAKLDPYALLNPYETHKIYGTLQLHDALSRFTASRLKEAVAAVQSRHPGTKPQSMSSKSSMMTYIEQHVTGDDGHIGPKSQAELSQLLKDLNQRMSLSDLRHALAALTRSEGNPNHGSDGRFSPGGGGPVSAGGTHLSYTPHVPANWQEVVDHASNPDGHTYVCPFCSKVTNGPMAGQKLGFVPGNDTPVPQQPWSHGTCPRCAEAEMRRRAYHRLSDLGYSDTQIIPILRLMHEIGMKGVYDAVQAQSPEHSSEQRAVVADLLARMAVIRPQVPTVTRDFDWTDANGNMWHDVQGAGGKIVKVEYVGHVGALMHIPGVTHVSHHEAGMAAGGAKSESIHEKSARLQQEQGLRAEHGPVTRSDELTPVNPVDMRTLNPYHTPSASQLRDIMGEHQLGATINTFVTATLREMARESGIDTKGIANNHDALVSAITAHATQGRYSADFRSTPSAPEELIQREKTTLSKTGRAIVSPRGLSSEELSRFLDQANNGTLGDGERRFDTEKVWQYAHGDPHTVFALLSQGTATGELEHTAREEGIPLTSNARARIAQQITEHLDRVHNGTSARFGNNGAVDVPAADHPDRAAYLRDLQALRDKYTELHAARPDIATAHAAAEKAASGTGKATKTAGKSTEVQTHLVSRLHNESDPEVLWKQFGEDPKALQKVLEQESEGILLQILRHANMPAGPEPRYQTSKALAKTIVDRLVASKPTPAAKSGGGKASGAKFVSPSGALRQFTPVRTISNMELNPYRAINPVALRTMYGDDQLRDVLSTLNLAALKSMAKEYNVTSKQTKIALIDALESYAKSQPLLPSTPPQRTSLATLSRRMHTLRTALKTA